MNPFCFFFFPAKPGEPESKVGSWQGGKERGRVLKWKHGIDCIFSPSPEVGNSLSTLSVFPAPCESGLHGMLKHSGREERFPNIGEFILRSSLINGVQCHVQSKRAVWEIGRLLSFSIETERKSEDRNTGRLLLQSLESRQSLNFQRCKSVIMDEFTYPFYYF